MYTHKIAICCYLFLKMLIIFSAKWLAKSSLFPNRAEVFPRARAFHNGRRSYDRSGKTGRHRRGGDGMEITKKVGLAKQNKKKQRWWDQDWFTFL